jgi:hypothetical protein
MSTFPNPPRLLKGGIVLHDPETAVARRIILLQRNPYTPRRSLQIKGATAEVGNGNSATQRAAGRNDQTRCRIRSRRWSRRSAMIFQARIRPTADPGLSRSDIPIIGRKISGPRNGSEKMT